MRALAFIFLGLVIGGFAALTMANSLQAANAYPRGVMTLLGRHMNAAREQATAPGCSMERVAEHLEAMQVLARDVKPAFLADPGSDEVFARYADDLGKVSRASMSNAADCEQAVARIAEIGDTCKACHRDYK